MKVILFAPSKSSHTQKWALYYKQNGIDVTVVTFKDHFSPENAEEVHTITLPKVLPGKLSYLLSVLALKRILKQLNPDILHAHFISSYGLVAALSSYHPFFVSVWGTDIYQFPKKSNLNRRLIEYTLGQADVICSTSNTMARETSKYTTKNIKVTPFGVNLSVFSPAKEKTKKGLTLGIAKGLEDTYGFRDLFAAFSQLKPKFPELELLIIGDGPMKDEYQQLCRTLEIDDSVKFLGRVPNTEVAQYMKELDIVVLPSYEDSFGVTAVEAMACGIPVVVSDADGLKEVVLDQKTGMIVPKGNIEELAKAIQHLLEDKNLRVQMGQSGIEHVRQHYDWNENANHMISLYHKALNIDKN